MNNLPEKVSNIYLPDMPIASYVKFELIRAEMGLNEAYLEGRRAMSVNESLTRITEYESSMIGRIAVLPSALVELDHDEFSQFASDVGSVAATVDTGKRSIGFYQHKIRKLKIWQEANRDVQLQEDKLLGTLDAKAAMPLFLRHHLQDGQPIVKSASNNPTYAQSESPGVLEKDASFGPVFYASADAVQDSGYSRSSEEIPVLVLSAKPLSDDVAKNESFDESNYLDQQPTFHTEELTNEYIRDGTALDGSEEQVSRYIEADFQSEVSDLRFINKLKHKLSKPRTFLKRAVGSGSLNLPKIDKLNLRWQPRQVSVKQSLARQNILRRSISIAEENGVEVKLSQRQIEYAYGKTSAGASGVIETMNSVGYGTVTGNVGNSKIQLKPYSYLRVNIASLHDDFSPESIIKQQNNFETRKAQSQKRKQIKDIFENLINQSRSPNLSTENLTDMYGLSREDAQLALATMRDLGYGNFIGTDKSSLIIENSAFRIVRVLIMSANLSAESIRQNAERSLREQSGISQKSRTLLGTQSKCIR